MATPPPNPCSLVALYGPKPGDLQALLDDISRRLEQALGPGFRPYDREQVHATLIGLEPERGGDRDVAGFVEHLRRRLDTPVVLRFGGYAPSDRRLSSRGRTPYQRSFSIQGDRAVLIGWPIVADDDGGLGFPPTLDRLRREAQRFGITHAYHARPDDIDNDAYLRVGLLDRAPESRRREATEESIRAFLAAAPPVDVALTLENVGVVEYVNETLPRDTTLWRPLSGAPIVQDGSGS